MSIENPEFNQEQEKMPEQLLEDLTGKTIDDFLQTVVDSMNRFKDKKTFVSREAIHALPKGEGVSEDDIRIIMEALPAWVEDFLNKE